MRKLSEFANQAHAEGLVDALLVAEIDSEVRGEGPHEVWVHDDRQLEAARAALANFDPKANAGAARSARKIRAERAQANERAARRSVAVGERWRGSEEGWPPLTLFLIAGSVLVAYSAGFDNSLDSELVQALSIEPWLSTSFLGQVRAGELWRLVTPMWIHFSLFHIAFNMMWLWRLGRAIESRHGTLALLGLVLLAQVPSALGQYLASGPNFGGMSGVVYGLFGFAWMQSRYDRSRGYVLGDDLVVMMMLWFVLCLTGIVGPIANVGHAGGLIAGLAAGTPAYLAHRRAHDESPAFESGAWANTLRGRRRFVRRWLTPYAPLWFLGLALLGVVVDFWPN